MTLKKLILFVGITNTTWNVYSNIGALETHNSRTGDGYEKRFGLE